MNSTFLPSRFLAPNCNLLRALAFAFLALGTAWAQGQEKLEYNRDIRPILADNCFACHGPDSAARKADLRLDQREAAVEYGAIEPGKPDNSALVARVFAASAEEVMPPPATKKTLTAKQKETLKRWVSEGAEYQPHWSFIPPQRPALPAIKNKAWPRNAIDHFVLARLEAAGLSPAPEADRRTLVRRLSLDLTGLPPSPSVVEAFVSDESPHAYETLVDQLMHSKHWGEHRGRYWLDAARYADTHGIHFDNYREMWSYRDWVIGALNRNLPFDQFTIEQLAGDLLPNATLDQQIASGFNRCNITTNEGGIIDEEYAVLYARDRTETTSQVWMGLTTGCAVCHDHKFDPITTHDFYSLAAFFNNTTQAVRDGNVKDTPPILVVPAVADRPRWEQLQNEMTVVQTKLEQRKTAARGEFEQWLAHVKVEELSAYVPQEGLALRVPLSEGKGNAVRVVEGSEEREITRDTNIAWTAPAKQRSGLSLQTEPVIEFAEAGDFEADEGFTVSAWLRLGRRGQTGAIVARMDNGSSHRGWDLWLEGDRVGMHIVHAWPADALKVVSQKPLQPNQWTHVSVTYDGSKKAAGVKVYYDGQIQPVTTAADKLQSTVRTEVPLKIGQRSSGDRLTLMSLSDLRLYDRTLSPQQAEQLARIDQLEDIFAKEAEKRTPEEQAKAFEWWLTTLDEPSRELDARLKSLGDEQAQIKSRGTIAHVMNEKSEEAMAYILFRGEYDKRRESVKAEVPKALPDFPSSAPRNRLGLAKWLLAPEHPLTARVTVNRFWQELYGTGLVRTAGDFGISGELPSHPELLDWMAVEFRESGWDVKKFFKLLVTSATYRQAAVISPEKSEKDPQNVLLSRGPRFRMDGEMIRDYALSASGLLVPKVGGPSVKPYQPEGVWEAVAMIGSNTRDYKRDSGEGLYRRSMYTFWKRSAPPASMDIFNAPSRETCAVRRERTNTPLQALVTLNDVQFVEAARHLAQSVLSAPAEEDQTESRLNAMAVRLLARPFRSAELSVVKESLNALMSHYKEHPDDAKQLITVGESKPDPAIDSSTLAAWTMLANELMNLDEVLCK